MAVTQNTYTGNGSTVLYSFTFPYLDASHIQVEVNGALTTAYTLANATTIQFNTAPVNGASIRIYRKTADAQILSTFFPGSAIRAQDLNEDFNQSLYIAQETRNETANAVAGQIADGSIGTSKIADNSVTTAKIADNSVTTAKIADGAILNADVNANAGVAASKLSFTQAGTGAVARTVDGKLKDVVSVKDFGASSASSAAANLAAFKAAVAATATGGKLVIPADSSFYLIDTTGGLSAAVEINKRMEIVLEGDVKSNFGTMQANPPYIFNITADGVTISGNGKLIGNGTIDDTNSGTISTFPGLVRVAANNFTMTGVTVEAPPKVGVALVSCERAKIENVTFTGGPTSYTIGNTAHFAIYASGGGYHTILGNHFAPSDAGGVFTNCIFFASTSRCRVSDNAAKFAWEKLVYLSGDYNIVANNTYAAPVAGSYTDAYRLQGSHNKLIGNTSIGAKGACQVFDGVGNEVIGNNFIDCTQAGIFVGHSGGAYSGGFNQTKIIGNTVTGGTGTKTDGIRFSVDGASTSGVVITSNVVSSMTATTGEGLIRVSAVSPHSIDDALVANNRLVSGTNGVYLDRVIRSLVSGNLISGATNYAMVESGGAYNKFANNKARSISVIGINGLSATSYGEGNRYTDANLTGTVTLSAAVTTTVTHGGVAPNARVFLQEANTQAGVMIVSKGNPVTSLSGQDFAITMANGTAAAGTEQYFYQIIQ